MIPTRDAAYVARQLGKTVNWVKRNAHAYPHHRAGRTYFWTDDDIAAMLKQMARRSPADGDRSHGPVPMGRGRRS